MAVGVAPEAVEVGGGLGGFIAAILAFGLWLLWRVTIGFVILRIADMFAAVSIPTGVFGHIKPLNFAAKDLRKIDRNVNNALWQTMLSCEHFAVWLFLEAGHQVAAATGATYNGLEATGEAMGRLERSYLPWMFRTNVGPVKKSVDVIKSQTKTMDKTIKSTTKTATHTARVAHNTATVALPRVEVGSKTRDKTLSKRLTKVEKLLTAAGAAALVITGIAKLGLKWLRCPQVGKAGKAVCGMNSGLLESLIADAAVIASTISIVELGKVCSGFVDDTEGALKLFVRELK